MPARRASAMRRTPPCRRKSRTAARARGESAIAGASDKIPPEICIWWYFVPSPCCCQSRESWGGCRFGGPAAIRLGSSRALFFQIGEDNVRLSGGGDRSRNTPGPPEVGNRIPDG